MKCTQKKIADLLPWYVNNTLSAEEKMVFEKHLKTCSGCRTKLPDVQQLSGDLEEQSSILLSEHIFPEQLVLYAEAKHELTKEDFEKIDSHFKECSGCQRELQILKNVNASLKKNLILKFLDTLKNKINNLAPQILIGPALAYMIILLLLYPAYLGIFKSSKPFEPNVAEKNFELIQFDNRLESKTKNEITVSKESEVFSLSFNLPVLNEENIRYDATISNSNGKVIWEKKYIKSLDDYGTFLVIGFSNFFVEGIYKLTINEINRKENTIKEEFVFTFKVIKN